MAQCYQCGSNVEPDDRFCMQCGADYPARRPDAPSQPPPAQAGAVQGAPKYSTMPTWLPAEDVPNLLQKPTSSPQAADKTPEAASISCPKCGSKLPAGARFCGDCGERLAGTLSAASVPEAGFPARLPSEALPDPIPPLVVGPPPRPSAPIAQPVLPPFRAPGWANQPTPDVEIPDDTLTPLLTAADPQAMPGNAPPWGQAAPIGTPDASPAAQLRPWAPGQFQGPGSAGSFQPPFRPAQPVGNEIPFQAPPPGRAGTPPAAFLQAMAAVPPPKTKRRALSRGQIITMIIAAIVTVSATIGGLLTIFLAR